MLSDIAVVTGGEVISEELGLKLENTTMDQPAARQVIITRKRRLLWTEGQHRCY